MTLSFIRKSQLYFIFSFLAAIIIGTFLLKLPWVVHSGSALSWLDALFISTSAVCVTGLVTVTTSGFNLTGQLIILGLIQIGALGIMTLTASIVVLMGRKMNYSNTMILSNLSDSFPLKSVESLLRTILTYSIVIEFTGFLLLIYGFSATGKYSFGQAAYLAFFHSISAFCNAGFSTFDTSLIGMSVFIKIVVSLLIILGGLGVYVIYELSHLSHKHFLRIHTRLVLITTSILIVFGTLSLKFLEYRGNIPISWLDAYFQSVTARTAGFNTIPMDLVSLHPGCIIVLIALMLIGASPGGTGGGMKTTTAALVFISLYNTFKGNRKVLLFKREILQSNVLKAFTIMFSFIAVSIVAATWLTATDNASLASAFFEVASALGTVGLSLGISAKATAAGKIILIVCMFVGRIGPFTMFLFLLGKEKASRLEYPEERVILG
ncbi:MAG: potassium transporter TrkG [Victivallaceae bacterium]|nr:potassium transporter TrkG [Victivallaceae bacterium]